jgi:hypothetical protein
MEVEEDEGEEDEGEEDGGEEDGGEEDGGDEGNGFNTKTRRRTKTHEEDKQAQPCSRAALVARRPLAGVGRAVGSKTRALVQFVSVRVFDPTAHPAARSAARPALRASPFSFVPSW